MTKELFLSELRNRLVGLPKEDIEERVCFYEEMINDRMDEGKGEEEAIEDLGGIDGVVNQIAQETPLVKLVKQKVKPKRRLKGWEIALIIIGFPLWFPLLLTALILCIVAYLLVWILVIVSYSVELALSVTAIGGPIVYIINVSNGNNSILPLALGIMCMGGAILLFFGCIAATKGTLKLSKKIIISSPTNLFKSLINLSHLREFLIVS